MLHAGRHRARAAASSASPPTSILSAIGRARASATSRRSVNLHSSRPRLADAMRVSTRCIISFRRTAAAPAPTSHRTAITSTRSTSISTGCWRPSASRSSTSADASRAAFASLEQLAAHRLSRGVDGKGARARSGLRRIPRQRGFRCLPRARVARPRGAWPLRGPAHGRAGNARPHRLPRLPAMGGRHAARRSGGPSQPLSRHGARLRIRRRRDRGQSIRLCQRRLDRRAARSFLGARARCGTCRPSRPLR